MEGLAFEQSGHPVIVLTQNHPYGYALFDLAHELGHITLGHVTAEQAMVDKKIDAEADDEVEGAANRFAMELLTGDPECKIVPRGRNLNGDELAKAAILYAEKNHIDPLHIVLNYGYSKKHWGAAHAAIKQISKDTSITDQDTLRIALLELLALDELNDDDYTLLQIHLNGKMD